MDAYEFSGVLLEDRHRNLQHSNIILYGTNYNPWKLTIKRILNGIRVLRHVDGTFTPTQSDAITASSEPSALFAAFEQ